MGNKVGAYYCQTDPIDITEHAKTSSVAVDGAMYIYKFCAVNRTKDGQLFCNKEKKVTAHIYGLFPLFVKLKKYFKDVIFVFEGKSPAIKSSESMLRYVKKENVREKYNLTKLKINKNAKLGIVNEQDFQNLISYKKQMFSITEEIVDYTKLLCKFLGIQYIVAKGEGEKCCEQLVKEKYCDSILSNDWDCLALEIPYIYRNIEFKNNKVYANFIKKESILTKLGCTSDQLKLIILTAGCDYTPGIPSVGPVNAYKLVKSNTLEQKYPLYYAELIELVEVTKKSYDRLLSVHNNTLSILDLKNFLIKTCEINYKLVYKYLPILLDLDKNVKITHLILPAAPYANAPLHMGRVGGTLLPADILYRYYKKKGYNIEFLCTIDCHGVPIMENAQQANLPYKEFVDKWCKRIIQTLHLWNINPSKICTTMDSEHIDYVNKYIKQLHDKNYIKKVQESLLYCTVCKKYIVDRYVQGTCICGITLDRNECESCLRILEPFEIINPTCKLCNNSLVLSEQENYAINCSQFKEEILNHFNKSIYKVNEYYTNRLAVRKTILRYLPWGIASYLIPSTVYYVWIEALLSYLSFTHAHRLDEYKTYHFIGKDNTHFHTVIYGHLLKYANYKLPDILKIRNWFLYENKKQSASKIHYIDLYELDNKEPLLADFFRIYISYNDSTKKDVNLSLESYNLFVRKFFNTVHNLLYRVNTHVINKGLKYIPELLTIPNFKNYLEKSENASALSVLFKQCNKLNELFHLYRDNLTEYEYAEFVNKIYSIIYELEPYMPIYSENWLKSFLKTNYRLNLNELIINTIR
jgi:methionyl-tRNA synthetase